MSTQKQHQFHHQDFRDFNFEGRTQYLLSQYCELNDDLSTFACVSSTAGLEAALNSLYRDKYSYYDDVDEMLVGSGIYFIMDELPRNGDYVEIGRVRG